MAVSVRALNDDTSFFITFAPSSTPENTADPDRFPGSYTILIDPRLYRKALGEQYRPDMILITQEKLGRSDQVILQEIASRFSGIVVGCSKVIKRISYCRMFNPSQLQVLPTYGVEKSALTITLPAISKRTGSTGEIRICWLRTRFTWIGGNNAVAITYRAPSSVLTVTGRPSASPESSNTTPTVSETRVETSTASIGTAPSTPVEPTVSLLYTPHGLAYKYIDPWAKAYLLQSSRLTVLFHSLIEAKSPWYRGRIKAHGVSANGLEIASQLQARYWFGSHEEVEVASGCGLVAVERERVSAEDVETELTKLAGEDLKEVGSKFEGTKVLVLQEGQEKRIGFRALRTLIGGGGRTVESKSETVIARGTKPAIFKDRDKDSGHG